MTIVPRLPEMVHCGIQAYVDEGAIRCEVRLDACSDVAQARQAIEALLRQAATGRYWVGRWKGFDLDERWHVVRVEVSESGSAGIGGGSLNASDDLLTEKRHLVAAALAYLFDTVSDVE